MERLTWTRPGGGTLAFLDIGDRSAPVVVLLHGFPASSHLFRSVIPLLAPMVRVIAPDLFGGGASRPGAMAPTVADEVDAVASLLADLDVRGAALVGHGHGALVARGLASRIDVAAAVIIDGFAAGGVGWGLPADAADAASLVRAGIGRSDRVDADAIATYAEGYAGGDAFARALRALDAPPPAEDGLAGSQTPTLLVWGEDDPFVPVEEAERQSDALPGSTLAVLPGCSHFLPEDAPQTLGPLLVEYLRGRYLGRPHEHDARPITVYLGRRPPPEAEMMDT